MFQWQLDYLLFLKIRVTAYFFYLLIILFSSNLKFNVKKICYALWQTESEVLLIGKIVSMYRVITLWEHKSNSD